MFFSCSGRQVQESSKSPFAVVKKRVHFNKVLNGTSIFNLEEELYESILTIFKNETVFSYEESYTKADYIITIHVNEFKLALESGDPFENYLKGVIALDGLKFNRTVRSDFIVFLDNLDSNAYNENDDKIKNQIFNKFSRKLKIWLKYNVQ